MAREQPIELFMPPNMLKAKIGGAFYGIDMAAIRRAEAAMETLKTEFARWIAADVENLVAAREDFAKTPGARTRADLLRIAHDMKGQAATFEYPLIARVAGSLARLIGEIGEDNDLPLAVVDAHVHAVHVLYRDKITDMSDGTALALTEELEKRVSEILQAMRRVNKA